jgi:hypothetical protein
VISSGDVVEAALSSAIIAATKAGEWAVVAQLGRELEARRMAKAAENVVALPGARRRGGAS